MSYPKRRAPRPLRAEQNFFNVVERFFEQNRNIFRPAPECCPRASQFQLGRQFSPPDTPCSPFVSTSNVWGYTEPASMDPFQIFQRPPACDDFEKEIEKFARRRRSCTSLDSNGSSSSHARGSWRGVLSPKNRIGTSAISRKVFVGGLCRDVDSECLTNAFKSYGVESVEWCDKSERKFAYIIFKSEENVRTLLNNCKRNNQNRFYFDIGTTRPNRPRCVQLIPWIVDDADFVDVQFPNITFPRQRPQVTENTVFVGALHGEMTAHDLAVVMTNLFGRVVSVGLDTDKFMYPVGTGRVTFLEKASHDRAIDAEYITVDCDRFTKKLQIDPFLRDVNCSRCSQHAGPVFCRYRNCFTYFCGRCFFDHIQAESGYRTEPFVTQMEWHVPLMRNRVRKPAPPHPH